MYIPPAFRVDDVADIHRTMREARSATLVTATEQGLIGTPLPMLVDESEGPSGTLYAHVARANPQWRLAPSGEAMATKPRAVGRRLHTLAVNAGNGSRGSPNFRRDSGWI